MSVRILRAVIFIGIFFCAVLKAEVSHVYFSPRDGVADKLIERIDQEEKQILIAVYCFTHRGVVDALIRAKRRGVPVELIVDPFSLVGKMAMGKLKHAKMNLTVFDPTLSVPAQGGKTDRSGKRRPLMHNKFCVFGEKTVWTGSFNFTYDATFAHRENVVVIEDKDVAAKYRAQFHEIKSKSGRPIADFMSHHPQKQKGVLDTLMRK